MMVSEGVGMMTRKTFTYIYSGSIILSIFILNTLLWYFRLSQSFLNNNALITSIFGSTILIGFVMVFFLSTRNPILVKLFGGLETVYFWHRFLAMSLIGMIFIHQTWANAQGLIVLPRYLIFPISFSELGELARNGLILLVTLALFAKWMKYEHFKYIHRFMIVPYLFGLYHGFAYSWVDLFSLDYLSIWMIATSLVGIGSSLYMLLFYKHVALSNLGVITEKNYLNGQIIDLKVEVMKVYRFKPGQFAFIRIQGRKIKKQIHPFSISGSDGTHVYFTIKTLGDYTKQLYDLLDVPSVITISRPFGHMTFSDQKHPQVWIAGGVGITPFIGKIRSLEPIETPTHLFYSVRNQNEAVHMDLFEAYQATHKEFTFTLVDQQKDGYLRATHLPLEQNPHIYMCGPKRMVDDLQKQISIINKDTLITYEAFSFTGTLVDTILQKIRTLFKKYLPAKK
jgi:predicted ferric reductase